MLVFNSNLRTLELSSQLSLFRLLHLNNFLLEYIIEPNTVLFLQYLLVMQLDKVTRVMEIFEESVMMIREDRHNDLVKAYYNNSTLIPRMKDIIKSIEALAIKDKEDDGPLFMVELSKFKDGLFFGDFEGLQEMCEDQRLPATIRQAFREIVMLFRISTQQQNSMFDNVIFYKDIVKAILEDKHITLEELDQHENIAKDKRQTVWRLLQKVEELRQGQGRQGKKEPPKEDQSLQEQLQILIARLAILDDQHEEDEAKMAAMEKALKTRESELNAAKQQLKEVASQLRKSRNLLREKEAKFENELGQIKKESQTLQSSLAYKEQASGNLITTIEKLEKSEKEKADKIKKLNKQLKERLQELQNLKQELQESKNQLKKTEQIKKSQLLQVEKKFTQRLNDSISQIDKKESRIREMQQERQRLLSASRNNANEQLAMRASALLQIAQRFSQVYSADYPHNGPFSQSKLIQSQVSLRRSLSDSRQIDRDQVEIYTYLKKMMRDSALSQLMAQLQNLSSAKVIYKYPEEKSIEFKERLKGKKRLLLFCRTENGSILGGYAASGFRESKPGEPAFIFCAKEGQIMILKVKEESIGMVGDEDFLIFGNEQLSLGHKCNYVTSYFDHKLQSLHFGGSLYDRERFLQMAGSVSPNNRIPLSSYDILSLSLAK